MSALRLIRGDSQDLELTLGNLPAGGLAGADITFTIEGLLDKTIGNGITVNDEEAGTVTISIEAGDTDEAPDHMQVYEYDVQVTFADGTINTPVLGVLSIIPDVTLGAS